jgi:hypothetical protein
MADGLGFGDEFELRCGREFFGGLPEVAVERDAVPAVGVPEREQFFHVADAPPHFLDLIRRAGALDTAEQSLVFGESLPKGLRVL